MVNILQKLPAGNSPFLAPVGPALRQVNIANVAVFHHLHDASQRHPQYGRDIVKRVDGFDVHNAPEQVFTAALYKLLGLCCFVGSVRFVLFWAL